MFKMIANNDDVRLDASQYAGAITRWENEGGAPDHGTSEIGAKRKVKPASDRDIQGASQANARRTWSSQPEWKEASQSTCLELPKA